MSKLHVAKKKKKYVHIIGNQNESEFALDVNIQTSPLLFGIYIQEGAKEGKP